MLVVGGYKGVTRVQVVRSHSAVYFQSSGGEVYMMTRFNVSVIDISDRSLITGLYTYMYMYIHTYGTYIHMYASTYTRVWCTIPVIIP
jgi:hypothetical protein